MKKYLYVLVYLYGVSCSNQKDDSECNLSCEQHVMKKIDFIYNQRPVFEFRPNIEKRIFDLDSFTNEVCFIQNLKNENCKQIEELVLVYYLNQAIIDYKSCHQGYNLMDEKNEVEVVLLKKLFQILGENQDSFEYFPSSSLLNYPKTITTFQSLKVKNIFQELELLYDEQIEFVD